MYVVMYATKCVDYRLLTWRHCERYQTVYKHFIGFIASDKRMAAATGTDTESKSENFQKQLVQQALKSWAMLIEKHTWFEWNSDT
jgi:hypothetical protein